MLQCGAVTWKPQVCVFADLLMVDKFTGLSGL
jgi:hypothetical protein